MTPKPFAESSEQNREPILKVLQEVFVAPGLVLEIGSGTGQHAVYFAADLPHLRWQPTEVEENLPGIHAWRDEAGLETVLEPLALNVSQQPWPVSTADYVFSANTAHIMSWDNVEAFIAGVGQVLQPGGRFVLYGPFNYDGQYTSESNARFDDWLKARDPLSGVRDFEALNELAEAAGLRLLQDFAMPANNRILCWERE
jgi:cyclopropane fatty-acyl-phospholipid synthase-like methyltransferase